MNPFELQAQFARQWFDLVQTMTTTAMAACASMNEQTVTALSRSLPVAPAPVVSPPTPFPFFPAAWPAMTAPAPWSFSTPLASNPWQSNPFAAWMSLFNVKPASASPFPAMPFAPMMTPFWSPWAFTPNMTTTSWMSPFSMPARNPGAELLEQMATNYRTASGYAVAAVIGPLNAAFDTRTYGEPWWQKLDTSKKLN